MDIFVNCFVLHLAQGDFKNLQSYITITYIFVFKVFVDGKLQFACRLTMNLNEN